MSGVKIISRNPAQIPSSGETPLEEDGGTSGSSWLKSTGHVTLNDTPTEVSMPRQSFHDAFATSTRLHQTNQSGPGF